MFGYHEKMSGIIGKDVLTLKIQYNPELPDVNLTEFLCYNKIEFLWITGEL